jgi:hypothetical protein
MLFGEEIANDSAPVRRQPVPDDQQGAGNVPEQGPQEVHHLRALHRACIKAEIEVPEGDAGDDRKRLPVKTVSQNRRVAALGPGAAAVRPLAYSAFVDEDDRAPFAARFFLMAGHFTRRQWRISSSLRSRARPVGR